MTNKWISKMPAAQFRIARPTHQLSKIRMFYTEGLGLEVIGGFMNHDNYDGLMIGLPDESYHLEFTQQKDAKPAPPPTRDNLLVFYLPDQKERDQIVTRLSNMGYPPVEPENPYWKTNGITIPDPDGWHIVLQHSQGLKKV